MTFYHETYFNLNKITYIIYKKKKNIILRLFDELTIQEITPYKSLVCSFALTAGGAPTGGREGDLQ